MVLRSLKREIQVVEDLLSPRGRERTYNNKLLKLSALREDSGACLSLHRFWAGTVKSPGSTEPSQAGTLGGGSFFGGEAETMPEMDAVSQLCWLARGDETLT